MKSICEISTDEKILILTFDDGPNPIKTPEILEILKRYQAKATFFVIGKKIAGHEYLLKEMLEQGHIVANHSFSHSYFYDFYSTKKVTKDLLETNKRIKEAIGLTPKWFRPPYGVTNPNIAKAVKALELTSIGWNLRSLDTVILDKDKLFKRVINRIRPGNILLFHDTAKNSGETLKEVLDYAQKNGYKIVGLDELVKIKVYEEI